MTGRSNGMTDWRFHSTTGDGGRICKATILADGAALSRRRVMELWQDAPDFRERFNRFLAELPFAACFWETPATSLDSLDRPYEQVCVDAPSLAGARPDPHSFADQFNRHCGGDGIAEFANPGGDARLIAPCPREPTDCYAHLLTFVRTAPAAQRDAFWRRVGAALSRALSPAPLWLSTSGLGVHWLHARLDTRPKYYTYAPYRAAAPRDAG
ncbi:hypothetical protein TspCOW1_25820 [Thiohalobacter sp. COW1]|nr:hypothetical protein TspCOW1_25820 [Thiohalobacter sp. COW1]